MRKETGSVGDFMAICICVLLMTILLVAYMDSVRLIDAKTEVNQIVRKYILRMEAVGYLSEEDSIEFIQELSEAGVTEVRLEGTTLNRVGYGEEIALQIQGLLEEKHEINERRVSTAKY